MYQNIKKYYDHNIIYLEDVVDSDSFNITCNDLFMSMFHNMFEIFLTILP